MVLSKVRSIQIATIKTNKTTMKANKCMYCMWYTVNRRSMHLGEVWPHLSSQNDPVSWANVKYKTAKIFQCKAYSYYNSNHTAYNALCTHSQAFIYGCSHGTLNAHMRLQFGLSFQKYLVSVTGILVYVWTKGGTAKYICYPSYVCMGPKKLA